MKTLLIIQSRMESKRLPNKSLFPINKIPLVVLVAKESSQISTKLLLQQLLESQMMICVKF